MKPLYVRTNGDAPALTPAEIADRLQPVFDHCVSDTDEAASIAKDRLAKYEQYFKEKGFPRDALDSLAAKWDGATILYAWDNNDESAKFRTVLCNDDSFILEFFNKLSWPKRRSIAKRVAEPLNYIFELGEEC